MAYGVDASRYPENKRAVEDKYIGPLVKTIMTRCIHCTRCIRFSTEVAGVPELGAIGRGEDMEITTYLEHAMTSELQSNVVDLCPVGALTSKPYAFAARPWELNKTQSIDVMDAVGSAIRIDTRGREVMRILPRANEDVNEEWISDKTRHVVDGLRTQRLDQPYVRVNGRLQPASWKEAFAAIAGKVKASSRQAHRRDRRRSRRRRGNVRAQGPDGAASAAPISTRARTVRRFDPKWGRASYLFNATIAGIEQADALLIIGSNPRREAAVLNARIRKRWRAGNFPIGVIGEKADLTYTYDYLGAGAETLADLGNSKFADALKAAERPLVLVGAGALGAQGRRCHRFAGGESGGRVRRGQGRLERLLRLAQRRLARRRARSRLRAGRGRARCGADGRGRRRCAVPARRRRGRGRAWAVRRLYRHPWRPRRASRRRDPAGRRLSGKIRDLREHRRPRADGQPRRVSAGRRARGLGDPARAVRHARPQAALRFARRAAAGAVCRPSASDAHRSDRRGRCRRYQEARQARRHA